MKEVHHVQSKVTEMMKMPALRDLKELWLVNKEAEVSSPVRMAAKG